MFAQLFPRRVCWCISLGGLFCTSRLSLNPTLVGGPIMYAAAGAGWYRFHGKCVELKKCHHHKNTQKEYMHTTSPSCCCSGEWSRPFFLLFYGTAPHWHTADPYYFHCEECFIYIDLCPLVLFLEAVNGVWAQYARNFMKKNSLLRLIIYDSNYISVLLE